MSDSPLAHATRRLDHLSTTTTTIAALDRRGTFTARGYRSPAAALADLLGGDPAGHRAPGEDRRPHRAPERAGRPADAVLFATIATAVDAHAKPLTAADTRSRPERQAHAPAEVCGFALDHGADGPLPECGARMVPIVMNSNGQPLDVGRASRVVPDGLRRAVAARDRGCAHPGCGRTASWTEIHHILPWEDQGETRLDNLVMSCRFHHRLMHRPGWIVRIRDGLPEFIPPKWIDPERRPRRKPVLLGL